ncbi:MAG: OadG family protein [Cyclobacteriaceae bacterium]|nr:OadG family protein [Cyclobacteriaceae bacterium]
MFDNFGSNIMQGDGLMISIVGYGIVFFALVFLSIIFTILHKVLIGSQKKKLKAKGEKITDEDDPTISGEVSAAISLALHLHFEESHDFEDAILTIKKVQKPYSPWSSKLYGLRQYPTKKAR